MTARYLMIAADSMEPDLLREWSGDGTLPGFAHLYENAAYTELVSAVPGLPGASWPEVNSGLAGSKHGVYFPPHQYCEGEIEPRRLRPDELAPERFYWNIAADHGLAAAAIDQIHTAPMQSSSASQLVDWGAHDRLHRPSSAPPELLAEVDETYGSYPMDDCDGFHGGNSVGYGHLTERLLLGAERKTNLSATLVADRSWDIVSTSFGEGHCAGHQMWHLMDRSHPRHDPSETEDQKNAIKRIYQDIDRGMARTIEAAGDDAVVFVVAAKGMTMLTGGHQLIPEVLHRLGLGAPLAVRRRLWSRVPSSVRSRLLRTIPGSVRNRAAVGQSPGFDPGASAVSSLNDQDVGIRFSIRGRDPHGSVSDESVEEIKAQLAEDLRNLMHTESGEPIVENIIFADDDWDPVRAYTIPDVLISFRKDIGLIESCVSPKTGTVRGRVGSRTGNHNGHNALWVLGSNIDSHTHIDGARTVDIPATMLAMADVPLPEWFDGKPIDALLGNAAPG
jgi:predicted AlkP superfamily phosphohydrolase/phosphomutase